MVTIGKRVTVIGIFKDAGKIVDDTKKLFLVLYKMFFSRIDDDRIKRFEHEETRNFYQMFMD